MKRNPVPTAQLPTEAAAAASNPAGLKSVATALFENWYEQYRVSRKPISVELRNCLPLGKSVDRASHGLHPYPAKLLQQIPCVFLNATQLHTGSCHVLDPFCGSGTVLVEAALAGHTATGLDVNPFACFLTRAKTDKVPLREIENRLQNLLTIDSGPSPTIPDVVNIELWYEAHVISQLASLRAKIELIACDATRSFFLVAFSKCANLCSRRDPRISVPVRSKESKGPVDVRGSFVKFVYDGISRMARYQQLLPTLPKVNVHNLDVLHFDDDQSYDLIVTSPPYLGAQKYVRSSYLSLGWLSLCSVTELRRLESRSIGREHFYKHEYAELKSTGIKEADRILEAVYQENPLRGHMAAQYLLEMTKAIGKIWGKLRDGGHLVIVAGDNYLVGRPFETSAFINEIISTMSGSQILLELRDRIATRALLTKRKNSAPQAIGFENITVFRKNA